MMYIKRKSAAKHFWQIIVWVVLVGLCLTGIIDKSIYALNSINPNAWVYYSGTMLLMDNRMILKGEDGAAVYEESIAQDAPLMIKARFSFDRPEDSWVAFKFRSDQPDNQIWDNRNTYFFLIRQNSITAGRVVDGQPVEYLVQKQFKTDTNKEHEIELGVVNSGPDGVPRLIYNINGKAVIDYTDMRAGDALRYIDSYFSVNVFQGGEIEIETADPPGAAYVDRELDLPEQSQFTSLLEPDHKWLIAREGPRDSHGLFPSQYNQTVLLSDDENLTLQGMGSIVYKNKIESEAYRLEIMLEEQVPGSDACVTIVLKRSNREDFYGQNGLGLVIFPDGRMGPVVYKDSFERAYPLIRTGYNFNSPKSLYIELAADEQGISLYVYIEQMEKAWHFQIDQIGLQFDQGMFFGLFSQSIGLTTKINQLEIAGRIQPYMDKQPVYSIYLPGYFSEQGTNLLHWQYRADQNGYKAVILNTSSDVVGEVIYPKNTFIINDPPDDKTLYIVAESIDGVRSEPVAVDLTDERPEDGAKPADRVIIIPDKKHGASFYLENSREPFFINGFNYIRLRYGDHATFEPETELTPAEYDPFASESLFQVMHMYGFNTVRVFIAQGRTAGNPGVSGADTPAEILSAAYLDNVVDFIERARKYGIYIILCFGENELPYNQHFSHLFHSDAQSFLFSKELLNARIIYLKYFLTAIKAYDETLLATILAVQEQNEFFINPFLEPFRQIDGLYTFYANGTAYNMSNEKERRKLVQDALLHYYRQIKQAISAVDPDLLLTVGSSTIRQAGMSSAENFGLFPVTQQNIPLSALELLATDIDFLNIHVYNWNDASLSGWEMITRDSHELLLDTKAGLSLRQDKPVVLSEFGAARQIHPTFEAAAVYILEQKEAAVQQGYKGAVYWTFDTFTQTDWYPAMQGGEDFLAQLACIAEADFVIKPTSSTDRLIIGFVVLIIILSASLYLIKRAGRHQKIAVDLINAQEEKSNTTTTELSIKSESDINLSSSHLSKQLRSLDQCLFLCNFFGSTLFWHKGKPLRDRVFNSHKAQELLLMVLSEKRPILKEELIEGLWQDKDRKNPDNLFHATLYQLRKSLKKIDPDHIYIQCENKLYDVEPNIFQSTDILFGNSLEQLLSKDVLKESEANVIEQVNHYYEQPFLHGFDQQWADKNRAYYQRLHEQSVLKLSKYYLEKSINHMKILKQLHTIIVTNPYLEEAYKLLMQTYAVQGDYISVKKTYLSYQKTLARDLNTEPTPEMAEIYRKILGRRYS